MALADEISHPVSTLTNRIVFTDVLATARELGEQHGKGRDSQIKFLLKVVEGGYHEALDLTPHKHADGIDDATALAKAYVEAQQGAIIFDAKAMNQRKLISTIRLAIKLGTYRAAEPGEPLGTVSALMSKRLHYKRVPMDELIVDDAANTLLKYARAQVKRDTLIPGDELDVFCFRTPVKRTPVDKTLEFLVHRLDRLLDGAEGLPNVVRARNSLKKELAKMTAEAAKAAPLQPADEPNE